MASASVATLSEMSRIRVAAMLTAMFVRFTVVKPCSSKLTA